MPIKYKESSTDNKGKTTHYYIHTISLKELYEALDNHNTPNKRKHKIRNELVRRGVETTPTTSC
jgi:hypothetical protein